MTPTKYTYNDKTIAYEISNNGYEIYLGGNPWISQPEPYAKLFKADGTYEENCLMQIEDIVAQKEQTASVEDTTLDMLADHEARLSEIELGITTNK